MSFRQENRQKNNCPSRGLGLAAAAIGIGVGAAMYYFFSKRPENQHQEASTSSDWETNAFDAEIQFRMDIDSDEYSTISENETSDTSVHDNDSCREESPFSDSDDSKTESLSELSDNHESEANSSFNSDSNYAISESDSEQEVTTSIGTNMNTSDGSFNMSEILDSDIENEWDVTNSSEAVPEYYPRLAIRQAIDATGRFCSTILEDEEKLQAFRERPWTTEECSICFEVISRDQVVMTLPCTHHFHQACILPWLEEQQTCPNCRKAID